MVGVTLQVPPEPTDAVPNTVEPLAAYSVMVSPTVPVPLMAGLALLVMLSPRVPVSPSVVVVKTALGAAGAVLSTLALSLALIAPRFPATSVNVALTVRVLPSPGLVKLV